MRLRIKECYKAIAGRGFIVILLGLISFANANELADVGLPIITNFTQEDYDAHHASWDIEQADNGLVYISNGNSLVEYDGEEFNRYFSPNKTTIRDIAVVEDRIYAATINTIGYYQADVTGVLQYHSLDEYVDEKHKPFDDTFSITEFKNKIIFKAIGHIFIWDGESVRTVIENTKSKVKIIENDGKLYIKLYGDKVVYGLDLEAENIFKPTPWKLPAKAQIKSILTDDDGNKVFFTAHFGVYKQNNGGLIQIENLLDDKVFIYDAIKSNRGYYYVVTINSGLFILSGDFKLLKNYHDIHGLNNSQIMAVMQDNQNNIWMVGNKGINFMRPPNEVSRYAQDDNIYVFNFVNIQGKPSFVGKKIQQLQTNTENPFYPPKFSAFGDVEGISQALDLVDQTFLAGNTGLYLVKINNHQMLEHELIFDKTKFIFDIAATDDFKIIFFSTDIGMFYLENIDNQWHATPVKGLDFEVNSIEVEDNSVLWIGSRTSELYRLEIETMNTERQILEKFTQEDGLGANVVVPNKLGNGMFFGTNDGLLYYSKVDNKLQMVDDWPEIFTSKNFSIGRLYQDINQRIWYTIGGFMGYIQKQQGKWINQKNLFSYFPSRSINNFVSIEPDIIWFMQTGGEIFRMNINEVENIAKISPLYIRKIQNSISEEIIQTGTIDRLNKVLDIESNSIRVSYALVDFATPNKALYRTKLKGSYNPQWSKWTSETYRDFTELRGNDYVLEVQAKDGFGRITESTKLDFKVLPPFYLSNTAIVIYLFLFFTLLILTAWLVQRWRTKKLKAHNVELASLVDRKTIEIQGHVKDLEQQQELKTRFFTNVSHELRTPLSLIILPLQKLIKLNQKNLDKESKDLLSLSLKNADGMKQLVNEVLDISRFEEKSMPIVVQKNDLVGFVGHISEQFQPWANENNQKIKVLVPDGQMEMYFDRDMFEKIVSNLLTNAIKYSGENTTIKVSFFSNSDNLGFIIKDDGIGIVKEQCQRVFERYFQSNNQSKQKDSSGIGLAFVKEMVELHQGKIELTSDAGQGCEFVLTFKPGNGHFSFTNQQAELEVLQTQKRSHPENTPVVMIVEDNTDLRSFICKSLSVNYIVIQAINGVDALQVLDHELPDLIISDIMMPQMDGIEFLQKLRRKDQFKTIPFILLSSKSSQTDRQLGLQYGADDYLTKPFDMDELFLRVNNMINSRRLIRNQVLQQIDEIKQQKSVVLNRFEEKLRYIILENISNSKFNVNSLAGMFGLERSALYRKSKKELNISPTKYIHQVRLETAKELLEKQHISISEVAYATGFESLSYFSKSFKNKYGQAPSIAFKSL